VIADVGGHGPHAQGLQQAGSIRASVMKAYTIATSTAPMRLRRMAYVRSGARLAASPMSTATGDRSGA